MVLAELPGGGAMQIQRAEPKAWLQLRGRKNSAVIGCPVPGSELPVWRSMLSSEKGSCFRLGLTFLPCGLPPTLVACISSLDQLPLS